MSIQVSIMYVKYMVHSVIKTVGSVHRWLEPRTGQTNDYNIDICCFSAKELEQSLVGSESGELVLIERHLKH